MTSGPWRSAAAVLTAVIAWGAFAAAAPAATPITKLADRITSADLRAGVLATQEALARGGIATRDGSHVVRRAVKPAASSAATSYAGAQPGGRRS